MGSTELQLGRFLSKKGVSFITISSPKINNDKLITQERDPTPLTLVKYGYLLKDLVGSPFFDILIQAPPTFLNANEYSASWRKNYYTLAQVVLEKAP